jgi:hypothetical protein
MEAPPTEEPLFAARFCERGTFYGRLQLPASAMPKRATEVPPSGTFMAVTVPEKLVSCWPLSRKSSNVTPGLNVKSSEFDPLAAFLAIKLFHLRPA